MATLPKGQGIIPLPPFKAWLASNIPAVYDNTMTYYEELVALIKYLQDTVVPAVNDNAEAITVLSNFVEHYFDNLDVQQEIIDKLDQMAEDGSFTTIFEDYFSSYVNPQIESQNRRISVVEDQVNSAVSGQPKAVSSTSQMTDHNQIYVNTTDNKWYYWNGSDWTIGGSYPASSIGNGSVTFGKLSNQLAGFITELNTNISKLELFQYNTNSNSVNFTSPFLIKAGTTITVSSDFVANYNWRLTRVPLNSPISLLTNAQNIKQLDNSTTYTVENDEYCVFQWCPIDADWDTTTYEVDRTYKPTSEDVSMTFYFVKNDKYKLIDYSSTKLFNNLFLGVNYNTGNTMYTLNRLVTPKIYSAYPIALKVKSGYEYAIGYYASGENAAPRTSATTWLTSDILIPANQWFSIAFRLPNNASLEGITDYSDIFELFSYADFKYIDSYVDSHISSIGLTYNYRGINLDMQYKHGYTYEASTPLAAEYRGIQGFTVYGDYIFQFYANGQGVLRIFNKTSGALVAEHTGIYSMHGGSCAFSNKFYDASDDFPLLYVSTGYSNNDGGQITVLRVKDVNTVSLVKMYHIDPSIIGYASEQCYDFETGLCYSFGYTKNSYSDMTDNPVKVTVLDLNKETSISETNPNLWTLEVVDNYEIPYVYVIQSCKFKNGLCYIVSSYQGSVQASDIKVYDPSIKSFVANFPNLPQPLQGEIEALDFVENATTSKYDMIVGVNGDQNYWKLSFM